MKKMKKINALMLIGIAGLLSGCVSTVTHYDAAGKVTKVEKTTNFARVMDGTNAKSQMILVDGLFLKSDISATAGENFTPGWVVTYGNGKIGFVNAKGDAKFTGVDDVVKNFFEKKIEVGKDGLNAK